MPIYGRVVMAALGCLVVWKIVNAVRSGVLTSRGVAFDMDAQPILFGFGLAIYALCVLFCGWIAAGYEASGFWQFVGPR